MLAELMPKLAEMDNAEEEGGRTYRPRPSMGGPERCLRQMVYFANNEPAKPLGGRALEVFSDGNWAEELTFDRLRRSAFKLHSEQMGVTLRGTLPFMPKGHWSCGVCGEEIDSRDLHGHLDALCTDILGVDRVIDHKSSAHFSFEAIWAGDHLPLDYLTQLAIYTRGVQQDNPEVRECLLLYKNKNTAAFLDILCEYDNATDTMTVIEMTYHNGEKAAIGEVIPNIVGDALKKFADVDKHLKAKTLPKRQYEIDHWRCGYCAYSKTCWGGWPGEHRSLAVDKVFDEDMETMLKYERELQLHESGAKKERAQLRKKIKEALEENSARSGRAGDYIVEWTVKDKKKFDRSLLPPGAEKRATKTEPGERLTIRNITKKREENE